MRFRSFVAACCVAWVSWAGSLRAAEDEPPLAPLFNGTDLEGWVQVNCHPETFTVRDGLIVCTGEPYGILRSDRMYENFVMELEWKHLHEGGNSGLFVWSDPLPAVGKPFSRAVEVQILDGRNSENYTSHGDIFGIQGASFTPDRPHPGGWARSLPTEHRCKPAGHWNHYRVVCNDGAIQLSVNGKEVSGGHSAVPRKGYICLEAEGSEVHFRNLRIRELPSTDPEPDEIADRAEGFRTLYNGIDFEGWQWHPGHEGHWVARDWRLQYDGQSQAPDKNLWTDESFGDVQLIVDWRWTGQPRPTQRPIILPSGEYQTDEEGNQVTVQVPDAGDSGIYLRGSSKAQINIWCWPAGSGEVWGYRTDGNQPAEVRAAVTPRLNADRPIGQWNRFLITLRGDRLTVDLNGERVIEDAQLPGIPAEGPIALQHHGDPIEFANLFIRNLNAAD
jgi:hypothetical protein